MRFETGNLETLRHLVDEVGGMTLLPYLAVHYPDEKAMANERPFAAPAPSRDVRVVQRRAGTKHSLVSAYTAMLVACVTPRLPR